MKKIFLASALFAATTSLFAATVTLYDQPESGSKSIGQVDSSQVKPFYKKGEWLKVGDQANGQVGWIKSAKLQAAKNKSTKEELASIQQAQKEAEQAKSQFEQQYQQTVQQLNQRQESLLQKLNRQQNLSQPSSSIQSSLKQTSVSYAGNGQDGKVKVTEQWTNKDGKLETKTYEMPVAQYNKQQANAQSNSAYQQMQQRHQQMEAYMNQMMQQMQQQFGSSAMPVQNNTLSTGNPVISSKSES
ncbi:hypothetical protein OAO18_00265 [Francisellaceae bacterium]|nr:hypothetical protein [Francisellaceae bacterium]